MQTAINSLRYTLHELSPIITNYSRIKIHTIMTTTTFSNPKMSFQYYFIDNGRYRNTTNRGRTYFPARLTHYAETLQEAIEEAKGVTCGERIEIKPRYGLGNAVAYVEPDGTVIQGMELVNLLRNEK